MKKLLTILLGCSLGFTAGAYAKPDDAKKKAAKSGPPHQVKQQHVKAAPRNLPPHVQAQRHTPNYNSANVNPAKIQRRELKEQEKALRKSNAVQPRNAPVVQPRDLSANPKLSKKQQQQIVSSNQLPAARLNKKNVAPLSQERIQAIRAQHQNFHARPNTSIASAQFNQNYRIQNAQNWTAPQYRAFQTYRPQWHDRNWYHSNYGTNLLLIGGGWYFWNSGYWYPAWGYDESAAYYPYDGPIYVGHHARPFDQVVADVQATLQEQGYYRGEVDGLMGPLTREALAGYQRDHGLINTAALDEPTLDSLGLG
jgi:hypothetical protein